MRDLNKLTYVVFGFMVTVACGGGNEFKAKDDGAGGSAGAGGTATGGASDGGSTSGGTGGGGTTNTGGTGGGAMDGGSGSTGVEAGTMCTDLDDDFQTTCDGDCDDSDPSSYLGAKEVCGDDADNDCNGSTDEGCNGLGTFVSTLTGDDSNPGTKTMPVKTIATGIVRAQSIGGGPDIYVAQGQYNEKVVVEEDISLLGGYDCAAQPCSWARDINANVSEIVNADFEGVLVGHGISRVTVIDGFTIQGLDGDTSSATPPGTVGVTILGGAPTITRNDITGGTSVAGSWPSGRSAGIAVLSDANANTAGPRIDSNKINGGLSAFSSVGILFDARPAATGSTYGIVTRNVIHGGDAQRSAGINAWTSDVSVLVQGNDITGGTSSATGFDAASWGIEVGGGLTIDSNRINTRSGASAKCATYLAWCGGILSESSTTTITNNVILGADAFWSAAVSLEELERPAGAVVLNANYIHGAGSGAQYGSSAAVRMRIGTCTTCGFTGRVGSIRNNILVGGLSGNTYGVREEVQNGKEMHPVALENNQFFVTGISATSGITSATLYRYNGGLLPDGGVSTDQDLTIIDDVNNLGSLVSGLPASDNQDGDPLVDATYHLTAGSPCIDAGTATEAPVEDFEGDARPQGDGVDIGPDEVN